MKHSDFFITLFLFYAGWFGSVWLAAGESSVFSLVFPLVLVLFLGVRRHLSVKSSVLALAIALFGIAFDFLLIRFGFVSVKGQSILSMPLWLVSIWLLFSFSILKLGPRLPASLSLASLLGFLAGPLSYKSGEIFQVLTFASFWTVVLYALFWAVFFPSVLFLSRRLL